MTLAVGEQRECEGDRCSEKIVGALQEGGDGKTVSPITALPKGNGNVLLWRDVETGEPRYAIIGHTRTREYLTALGVPLRLNHFADCPARRRFGRGGSR